LFKRLLEFKREILRYEVKRRKDCSTGFGVLVDCSTTGYEAGRVGGRWVKPPTGILSMSSSLRFESVIGLNTRQ
jgi:hypothetical protein